MHVEGDSLPYGGTLVDSLVIWGVATSTEGWDALGLACLALVDLPFSILADTLLLPYSILRLFWP